MNEQDIRIDSDEAALLYVAGEMSAEMARRFESRLADDAGLRARVDAIRGLDQMIDASSASRESIGAARREQIVRGTVSQMKQAILTRPVEPDGIRSGGTIPKWMWPVGAVAASIAAYGLWVWRGEPPVSSEPTQVVQTFDEDSARQAELANLADSVFGDIQFDDAGNRSDEVDVHLLALVDQEETENTQ
jgi:anti-sigma factor RsiW